MNFGTRMGLKTQLIFPFVIISLTTTLLLGYTCVWKMSTALSGVLEEKSQTVTRSLANALSQPVASGDRQSVQRILDLTSEDPDLQYAEVILPNGTSIRSAAAKISPPNETNFAGMKVLTMTRRSVPNAPTLFEQVIPLTVRGKSEGMLRLGFTNEHANASIQEAESLIGIIGGAALLLGVMVYMIVTGRSILQPIKYLVETATRISRGDLAQTVAVTRGDEIGQLLGAMNNMVSDLRDMAHVADSIASGDLSVRVEPRSESDVFGTAFKKMVESLNDQTKELVAREERFRSLCQTSPVGIFETDAEGSAWYANECWEQMSGLKFMDMAGLPWFKPVHPADQPAVIKAWQQMSESSSQENFSAELRVVRPSGEVCWGHCLGTRFKPESANPGYVFTIEDITKRKVSDMAQYGITAILAETKSVEQAAPRILELACHTLDLEAAILWKVDETDSLLKLAHAWYAGETQDTTDSDEEFICPRSEGLAGLVWTVGRPMWMDRDHMVRNVAIDSKKNILEQNERIRSAFACPVQVHHKTIGVMEFYSRSSNKLNADLLESYSSVAMQLGQFTERLEAEMSAKQLAAIVECSDDAIISATLDGTIISWNKGAQNLFGYRAEEIVGQPIGLLLLDQQKEHFFELVADLLHDEAVEGFETVNVKQDGSLVDVSLTMSPVKSETEKIVSMSVIARDITHKKAVEERMREFYAIVSHELRTPLTSIRGALGLISEGIVAADSDEGSELINLAKNSVVRLVRLINDILDLRKIEGGNLELNLQNLDSAELVTKSIDAMRGLAQERGVNLVAESARTFEVIADSDRAIQVLTNLISNAIKYSPLDGDVTVTVGPAPDPTLLRFAITDCGPGIAEDVQHKLFGKFQQIDTSDSRAKEGTGLGLAISKAIVEQHGGSIGVTSTVNEGSTFWFELRLATSTDIVAAPITGNSILVVEDDLELCNVLKAFLSTQGYRSDFANTLGEAFEKLAAHTPDLILLDVKLPDGSGLEVIKHIRASTDLKLATCPVVVITATERNKKDFYGATIIDWLPKPFDYEFLRRSLVTAGGSPEGKKVLVVEDDDATRHVIMAELTTLGLTCIAAKDGVEAVQKASEMAPDLIILDVSLPRADGFDVISKLRGKTSTPPPVLIYSGRELAKKEKDQLRLGLTRYLTKGSVPREEFLNHVKQMLSAAFAEPALFQPAESDVAAPLPGEN